MKHFNQLDCSLDKDLDPGDAAMVADAKLVMAT
jgi:hypothetical protein